MDRESNQSAEQSKNTIAHTISQGILIPEYHTDNEIIKNIVHNMKRMLHKFHNNNPYIHHIASRHLSNQLVTINDFYEKSNKRPPKKKIIVPNFAQKQTVFSHFNNLQTAKKCYGTEQSVRTHHYNDDLPMALSVHDFKALYLPKTVHYIWSNNDLEYNAAMTLKGDLQKFLQLTDTQRAAYMADITDIKNVTDSDINNDSCDAELLGHRGVFAKKDIPEMSIIGVYTGIFIKDKQDMITLMQKMPLEYFQDYLFRIPLHNTYPKICGYQYGNRLSLINAASNYQNGDEETFNEIYKRANLMLITVKTGECPIAKIADNDETPDMLFFIAGRNIPQGTQLLYDYGNVYW
jgi:hypothetical protein